MATYVIDLTKFEPIGGYPNYLVSPDGIVVSICKNKPLATTAIKHLQATTTL